MNALSSNGRRAAMQSMLALSATAAVAGPSRANEGGGYASVRRGRIKPGMADEVTRRVQAHALPVLKSIGGFRSYHLIHGADDAVMVITVYATKAAAEESNRRILPWIRENLGPLMAGPLDAVEGSVLLAAHG